MRESSAVPPLIARGSRVLADLRIVAAPEVSACGNSHPGSGRARVHCVRCASRGLRLNGARPARSGRCVHSCWAASSDFSFFLRSRSRRIPQPPGLAARSGRSRVEAAAVKVAPGPSASEASLEMLDAQCTAKVHCGPRRIGGSLAISGSGCRRPASENCSFDGRHRGRKPQRSAAEIDTGRDHQAPAPAGYRHGAAGRARAPRGGCAPTRGGHRRARHHRQGFLLRAGRGAPCPVRSQRGRACPPGRILRRDPAALEEPVGHPAAGDRAGVARDGRRARRLGRGGHGRAQRCAGLRAGAPVERRRREIALDDQGHLHRGPRRQGDRASAAGSGPRRHRGARRGRHHPCRHPSHRGEGLLRQPGRAHRRIDAHREVGRAGRNRREERDRPREHVFPGLQRALGDRPGRGGEHRRPQLFRRHLRPPRRPAGAHQLRPRHRELHLADDPLHGGDGLGGLRHRRAHQARLGRGTPLRPVGGRGSHARDAADDRDGEPVQGAISMSRKQVIVKRLNSIQNFGAMDVLCTDKTGTLTQDRVVLERYVDVTNRLSEDVLRYAYMNSYYQTGLRNLLDRAILAHSDLDVERCARKVDEIPFDFQRRRMSVVIDYEGDHVLICKGAVEEIFQVCSRYQVDEDINPLINMLKQDLLEEYEALSRDGYRVVAIAYREFPRTKEIFSAADESDLVLLGYLAFFDPPKETATAALAALRKSGVATKLLTGHNALVTQQACRDVGLAIEQLVTGDRLRGLSDAQLTDLTRKANVFARLTPSQKEDIIRALQRGGHVVGFMGDGINDAPAMKTADVGISVDTAVDVAKESADIILLEKSLLVLEDGILEGRRVFGNITKYIKMGASSNFGNMFSVVGGSYFLPFLPMAPIQVLVNNLLYDFSQVGIPTDRIDDEYLQKPRKWNIASIKKFMIWIGPMSSIFDYTTFFLMLYFFGCIAFRTTSDPSLKTHYESLFHTGWFVESLLTQTLIVHIIRTNRVPFFQSRASWPLTLTTLIVIGVACALPYSPLAGYLGLVPLPVAFWPWMLLTVIAYSFLTHFVKTRFIRRYGAD